ncbi:hypothetical protein ABZZ04_13280 [Streptomyces sp. NPDC006435]|uniref:hypothetical protein n=1 Tax=Streptomyces sp. NPDC006435 TaxID=3154300 RepID=UPI0033AAAE7A
MSSHTARTIHAVRRFRTIRTAFCAAAVLGLGPGLTACSGDAGPADQAVDEPYEVTYEVIGKDVDEIQFTGGRGEAEKPELETVESPTLPWRKTVTLRGAVRPAVMPFPKDGSTLEISCSITYKGKIVKKREGMGMLKSGGCEISSPIQELPPRP